MVWNQDGPRRSLSETVEKNALCGPKRPSVHTKRLQRGSLRGARKSVLVLQGFKTLWGPQKYLLERKTFDAIFSDFWPPRSPLGARPARFQKIPQKWPTRPQNRAKTIRQPQIYFKNGFMALLGLGLGTRVSSRAPPRFGRGDGIVYCVCEIQGSLLWNKIFF